MKVLKYFIALLLFVNLFASCTTDDTVEDAVQSQNQEVLATGDDEDDDPDNDKGGG